MNNLSVKHFYSPCKVRNQTSIPNSYRHFRKFQELIVNVLPRILSVFVEFFVCLSCCHAILFHVTLDGRVFVFSLVLELVFRDVIHEPVSLHVLPCRVLFPYMLLAVHVLSVHGISSVLNSWINR
ncbi:hypothetical protein V6N11_020930 [Hibiscus sabdariffa]|uniref:Uncharacterized protein n=2 Tax=Hibiscus sabdariffa TaxID=183260 RepID=A0ABR2A8Q7_9ROSI